MWKQLSSDLQAATKAAARGLIHVGGEGISGRTGVIWGEGIAVTVARQARDGESVPVVLPGGAAVIATVHAWDARTGLAVLKVPGAVDPRWSMAASPATGSLVLTVAYPSPQGVEARLDVVRFAGGSFTWARGVSLEGYFQTDGTPFPGFTGAVVLDADGALAGFVSDNRDGNDAFVVPASDLAKLVAPLVTTGSPQQAWLGVSTRPTGAQGLALVSVDESSPASRAGWKTGDLLLSLASTPLKHPSDLVTVLAAAQPGVELDARLLRNGEVAAWPVTPIARL